MKLRRIRTHLAIALLAMLTLTACDKDKDAPQPEDLCRLVERTAAGVELVNVDIEATNITTPLIALHNLPSTDFDGTYYRLGNITLRNVRLTGMHGSLINDGGTAYCIDTLTLDRVSIQLMADSIQHRAALISLQHSGVRTFNVNNSTVGGKTAVACAAQ